ncbi:MAG: DUF3368 domain-containing protein [Gammaproteobacteria bacterium]|nr:DUF3368 domain-containing protein [Gammaproteobacteria bacterium]
MAKRLVAADASPLIGLAAAGESGLLREFFGTVTITRAVHDEVMAGNGLPGAAELAGAIAAGWVEVARNPAGLRQFPELGAGEASTLALALKHDGDSLVLMDEWLGRARARELGITVTGIAGLLLAARKAGLVKRIQPLFERLAQRDFRVTEDVVRSVLDEAGET